MIARTQQPPPPIEVRVTVDTMSQACYTHISMSEPQTAEHFLRRLRDTYEAHDLDGLWTSYSHDCSFPVLKRFGIEPTWTNYKGFMTTFIQSSRCIKSPPVSSRRPTSSPTTCA